MIGEGGQGLRLFPGQHAAQLALSRTQRYRQQRILLGGQTRSGEADQRAALPYPGIERFAFLRVRQFAVRQDQHGKPPRQQCFRRAATTLRKGIKRAEQVEKRADQGRIRPGILGCAEAHRAAAEAFIQQENPCRAAFRSPKQATSIARGPPSGAFFAGCRNERTSPCAAVAAFRNFARALA
jgi:hypothetical protein